MLIGLVGKSCSGKNMVGELFQRQGFQVWDLDIMSHEILGLLGSELKELFGLESISDRSAIAKIVFADPVKRTQLENLIYPRLREKIERWESENQGRILLINGALLYRSGFHKLCRAVVYVDAAYEVRLMRAMKRDGISKEGFDRREASQSDVDFRVVDYGLPLYVISNNGNNMEEVSVQVSDICDKINTLANSSD